MEDGINFKGWNMEVLTKRKGLVNNRGILTLLERNFEEFLNHGYYDNQIELLYKTYKEFLENTLKELNLYEPSIQKEVQNLTDAMYCYKYNSEADIDWEMLKGLGRPIRNIVESEFEDLSEMQFFITKESYVLSYKNVLVEYMKAWRISKDLLTIKECQTFVVNNFIKSQLELFNNLKLEDNLDGTIFLHLKKCMNYVGLYAAEKGLADAYSYYKAEYEENKKELLTFEVSSWDKDCKGRNLRYETFIKNQSAVIDSKYNVNNNNIN